MTVYFQIMVIFTITFFIISFDGARPEGLILQLEVTTGRLKPYEEGSLGSEQFRGSSGEQLSGVGGHVVGKGFRPSRSILEAIERTAQRYVGSQALQRANLTSQEWIALFRANIEIESGYDPSAVSKVGATGLGQLMPATAKQLGVEINDSVDNLRGSAEYLLGLLNIFGAPDLAIAAYNAGPQSVLTHGDIPPYRETREHVRKVLRAYFRLRKHYI